MEHSAAPCVILMVSWEVGLIPELNLGSGMVQALCALSFSLTIENKMGLKSNLSQVSCRACRFPEAISLKKRNFGVHLTVCLHWWCLLVSC